MTYPLTIDISLFTVVSLYVLHIFMIFLQNLGNYGISSRPIKNLFLKLHLIYMIYFYYHYLLPNVTISKGKKIIL